MQSFTLNQNDLDILAQFVSTSKDRPTLHGVNVTINDDDTITLVSTDSYRMHKTTLSKLENIFPNYAPFFVDNSPESELKYDSIDKLIKACKLAIAIDKKHPVLTISNTRVQYGHSE
jgi:DNA polymerase III sliding clamp (beta) subunit (PCNA family)